MIQTIFNLEHRKVADLTERLSYSKTIISTINEISNQNYPFIMNNKKDIESRKIAGIWKLLWRCNLENSKSLYEEIDLKGKEIREYAIASSQSAEGMSSKMMDKRLLEDLKPMTVKKIVDQEEPNGDSLPKLFYKDSTSQLLPNFFSSIGSKISPCKVLHIEYINDKYRLSRIEDVYSVYEKIWSFKL